MSAHLKEAERAAEDGGPRALTTIDVVCVGGCNGPVRKLPRQPEDPPEAVRLVYHDCNDNGASYHYEDTNGTWLEPKL